MATDAKKKRIRHDGCRTEAQKERHPFGRTRLQLIAENETQGNILQRLLRHKRTGEDSRHRAVWRLLEAGERALYPTDSGDAPAVLEKSKKEPR